MTAAGAQTTPGTAAPPLATTAVTASVPDGHSTSFDIHIQAPDQVRLLLEQHLELQRYRVLTDLDEAEFDRLLQGAERNVRDLLGTLGFFSPEVHITRQTAADATGGRRVVQLQVQPGEPARITQVHITFQGAIATDPEAASQRDTLRGLWSLRVGMPFTQDAWDDAKNQALRRLTGQRYPTGRIAESRADIDPDTRSVVLALAFDSGPAYSLGALQISGTERHSTELVTRLARLAPGSPYQQSRMLEAQQRLLDSGYFDSVYLTLDTQGDPAHAPVLVQLREARLQKVVLGLGASTDGGARASIEHTHHRLPWLAWRSVTRLTHDRNAQGVYNELTGTPDADNWRWVTSARFLRQQATSFEETSERYRVGRSQRIDRYDRSYFVQYDRARITGQLAPSDGNAVSFNYSWTQRNFDSLPFPSQGYGLGVEVGGGVTLNTRRQPFFRSTLRWLNFQRLNRSTAPSLSSARAPQLAMRAEAGAVVAQADAPVPNTQLFLTGGDTTVRGYGLRDIGVLQPDGTVAAGRYMASGSLELQQPIVVGGRLTEWEAAFFVDAGSVANTSAQLQAKVGVGTGVRWKSPVGPLQMDLAYGLAVKRLRLHLNVGLTF